MTIAVSEKRRDSNLELFRIVLMLAIIAHHYVVNSGLVDVMLENPWSANAIFLWIFGAWGKIGINCFLMITGYFMCKQQITLLKFLKLFLEILFYKIVFLCIFTGSGYELFRLTKVIKQLLPCYNLFDDFVACFLVFYLFIPFLNILIQNMTKKLHGLLLILLLAAYSVLPNLRCIVPYNYVLWFSVVYLIAAYLRCYPSPLLSSPLLSSPLRLGGICAGLLVLDIVSILGALAVDSWAYRYLIDCNQPLALLTACALFCFFKSLPLGYHAWINTLASSVFGVLLIHANSDAMRRWLWQDVLHNQQMFASPLLIVHALCGVIGVFLICSALDLLRIKLLEKPLSRIFLKYGGMS